jgi:hypothetical protein
MRQRYRGGASHLAGDLVVGTEEGPGRGPASGNNPTKGYANGLHGYGAIAGAAVGVEAIGDDANIHLQLVPKGSGAIISAGPEASAEAIANAIPGGAKSYYSIIKSATALADNTVTDFDVACVVTVPNLNGGASIGMFVHGSLGDQDSSEASYWTIAVSRIAGAAAKAVVSAKSSNANTAGATANAAVTVSVSAMTGAVGATQTFKIQVKVARSAGASTNHDVVAQIELLNLKAAGISIA